MKNEHRETEHKGEANKEVGKRERLGKTGERVEQRKRGLVFLASTISLSLSQPSGWPLYIPPLVIESTPPPSSPLPPHPRARYLISWPCPRRGGFIMPWGQGRKPFTSNLLLLPTRRAAHWPNSRSLQLSLVSLQERVTLSVMPLPFTVDWPQERIYYNPRAPLHNPSIHSNSTSCIFHFS